MDKKRDGEDLKLAHVPYWPTWLSGSLAGGFLEKACWIWMLG